MMNMIGILGGMGPFATIDLFQKIVQLTPASTDQEHLPIIIINNPQIPSRSEAILDNGKSPLNDMIHSAKLLEKSGVDFIIIPCNTAHYWISDLQKHVNVPILNMIELTSSFITNNHSITNNEILLFATTATSKIELYQNTFKNFGLTLKLPSIQEQDVIQSAINEVKAGKIDNNPYIHQIEQIIRNYESIEVSSILGGCTEIPLLFPFIKTKMVKIDPTLILAKFAVKKAMNSN